jgi:hypothetical protein
MRQAFGSSPLEVNIGGGEKTLALLPKYRQPAEMSAGSGIG